mgnify:CR=1 FL=1
MKTILERKEYNSITDISQEVPIFWLNNAYFDVLNPESIKAFNRVDKKGPRIEVILPMV